MLSGIDTSWVQGNYTPSGVNFTIINASRGNNGGLSVGSYYHAQVDNARATGVEIGHYFFNGNIDPVQCADYFVDNLYGYRTGDALVLDVEYEASTGTAAWNPSQVLAFAQRVFERTGVKIGVYLNLSLIRGSDWSAVVAFGCWLWVAWPGDESEIVTGAWPDWTMWQYTIVDNLDRNYSKVPLAQLAGATITPEEDEDDMNGFYIEVSSAGAKAYFSPKTGKVRDIPSAEWSFLRAIEQSHAELDEGDFTGIVLKQVSQGWWDKAHAL